MGCISPVVASFAFLFFFFFVFISRSFLMQRRGIDFCSATTATAALLVIVTGEARASSDGRSLSLCVYLNTGHGYRAARSRTINLSEWV